MQQIQVVHTFNFNKPVQVYRNLTKQCYSVQQNGIVVAYTNSVMLEGVTFIVRPAGNKKVRDTGRKNVHAFVKGLIVEDSGIKLPRLGYYNPYKYDSFIDLKSKRRLKTASLVRVGDRGIEYRP